MNGLSDINLASRGRSRTTGADRPDADRGPGERRAEPVAFAEVFGATQALQGARIDALVKSIIPDGRGLTPAAPDAVDERLAQLSEDTRQQSADRRSAVADAARQTDTRRPAPRPRSSSPPRHDSPGPDRPGSPSPGRPTAPDTAGTTRPVGGSGGTSAPGATPEPSASAAPDRPVVPQAPTASRPKPAAVPANTQPPSPTPSAAANAGKAVGEAAGSAPATVARQIGELLGARPAGGADRAASAVQSTPAAGGTTARQGQTGARARSTARADRPPSPARTRESGTPPRAAFDRLVRSIRANIGRHESTARLQLNPPELGRIRVDVRLVQQRMQLQIRTQTQDAREAIAARLDGLRNALSQQGITVERIDVTSDGEAPAHQPATGGQSESRRNNDQNVVDGGAADGRSLPADDIEGGQETVPSDLAEWATVGAASEKRLDIRV